MNVPWFAKFTNYCVAGDIPHVFISQHKKKFLKDACHYFWVNPYLFRRCVDLIYRRCIFKEEVEGILYNCRNSLVGGHVGTDKTVVKASHLGFWTMHRDAKAFVMKYDPCQRSGNKSRR